MQGYSKLLQQWGHTVTRRTEIRAASAKNSRRPRTSQKPQSLHWPLRVLLQWLYVRQKLHRTCEFNKTWQPLFKAAVLEEACLSNKSLDALDGVYMLRAYLIQYGRKFWHGIHFGRLAVLRAIRQYFPAKICAIIVFPLNKPAWLCHAYRLIVSIKFTTDSRGRTLRFQRVLHTGGEKRARGDRRRGKRARGSRKQSERRRICGRCED